MATDRVDAAAAELVVGAGGRWPLPWQQPWVQALARRQRGHALLLHAAPGSGSLQAAVALAQCWLCEGGGQACGDCSACRALQARTHPDLMLLLPEEGRRAVAWPLLGDKPDGGEGGEGPSKSARKPSRQVRVEEVRLATDWLATTSARGRGKVLVLHPAPAMNATSAGALLKTLEEPPQGVRIVLTASDPQHLLSTVRSRCQIVRLLEPARAAAIAWLEGQGVADAGVLLDAAGGQPLTALHWSQAGVTAERWHALPLAIAQGRTEALQGWALPQAIGVLQQLCHDALRRSVGGRSSAFGGHAEPTAGDLRALLQWQRSLNRAARHGEHPWSEALLVESLVDEGRRALR
jgi:DNA polymerase-3 subunit delta'